MKRAASVFEVLIQVVIFYSLATYFLELQFDDAGEGLEGHPFFLWSERTVAAIFTIEYLVRWSLSRNKRRYPFTPLAIIDLLAVLPFYLGFLIDLRGLRLIRTLRVLRLFKLYRYNEAIRSILVSYRRVRDELMVLGAAVLLLVFLSGTIVFEAERQADSENFQSYNDGLWWSVVTLSTVGYGDKCPASAVGRIAATVTMVLGLGLFASFVSVIGGAFVTTLNERRRSRSAVAFTPETLARIAAILGSEPGDVGEEQANGLVCAALECYCRASSNRA